MSQIDAEDWIPPPRASTQKNRLLIHCSPGKTRPTTYDLPTEDFTYGLQDHADAEGAKEVVLNWVEHQPEPPPPAPRDFVKTNVMALSAGARTPDELTEFRNTHEIKQRLGPPPKEPEPDLENRVFGKPTRPSTPVSDVLSNQYQRAFVEKQKQRAQALAQSRAQAATKRVPQPTKASLLRGAKNKQEEEKPLFKLSRFRNVQSKLVTKSPPPTAASSSPKTSAPASNQSPSPKA